MENIEMEVVGDILTIKVDLSVDLGDSKSGKTRIIATTGPGAKVPGTDVTAGINIYRKKR